MSDHPWADDIESRIKNWDEDRQEYYAIKISQGSDPFEAYGLTMMHFGDTRKPEVKKPVQPWGNYSLDFNERGEK